MIRMLIWLAGAVSVLAVIGSVWVRLAPDDPARWHVSLERISETGSENGWLIKPKGEVADGASPIFREAPAALAKRFLDFALAQPRVTLLAQDEDGLGFTVIQRSLVFGFPDYITVEAVEADGGAALRVWSRSRYGSSDLGVNRARVSAWLKKLR